MQFKGFACAIILLVCLDGTDSIHLPNLQALCPNMVMPWSQARTCNNRGAAANTLNRKAPENGSPQTEVAPQNQAGFFLLTLLAAA
jgi:hypothetical protein